jgi:plastocyanin
MVASAAVRVVVTGRILAWAAGVLLVVGASSQGAGDAQAPPAASPSIWTRQDTGTLRGAVSAPWAVDDANSVVAVFVDGAEHGPLKPDPLIDQFDLTFVPHVLPVTVGTRVRFRNSDTVLHNVFSPSDEVAGFDLGTYSAGGERSIDFEVPGEVVVLCNVHPQMSAFVLVLETAFWGVTDEAGDYSLGGIPAGTHRVTVWNQVAEPLEAEVTIVPGAETRADFVFSERRRGGWIRRRLQSSVTSSASLGMPEEHPVDERTRGYDR